MCQGNGKKCQIFNMCAKKKGWKKRKISVIRDGERGSDGRPGIVRSDVRIKKDRFSKKSEFLTKMPKRYYCLQILLCFYPAQKHCQNFHPKSSTLSCIPLGETDWIGLW